ncbi:hypothetical protein H8R18_06885 [Nanchangia anserum]|uniref:Uncharacterized protein n=1 Tax=Nanchangia anserum TaxID=2692125 RepID=A0A8I0KPU2_9ACTO|nr:hypothetical protein [Nanchangia anserum]MBD3689255.1 hypothetical protein [Nanchangia anserum]QOX81477.1 hypothetical protein H8R18_06885 [Nanchangia anserum]
MTTDLTGKQRDLRGSTTITRKALHSIAQAATSQTLRVAPDDVSVSSFDDEGKLGVTVKAALRADDLERCSVRGDHTLFTLVDQARETIRTRLHTVSGHRVGHVNVYVTGISRQAGHEERRELQ